MIRALILYYLSIKATHGYEIQKFIQVQELDKWTKIQSGSIYYALAKLEKEGFIYLQKEETVGAKVRKIYAITEKGKDELEACLEQEMQREVYPIGSDKFIMYPLLNSMDSNKIKEILKKHLRSLENKKQYIEKWKSLKVDQTTLEVERLCFEMMSSSVNYQIKWHEALIKELETCKEYGSRLAELIRNVDFSSLEEGELKGEVPKEERIQKLKQEILENPEKAASKLEELITLMKK